MEKIMEKSGENSSKMEESRVLTKKNNIISRITYSQIDLSKEGQNMSLQSRYQLYRGDKVPANREGSPKRKGK